MEMIRRVLPQVLRFGLIGAISTGLYMFVAAASFAWLAVPKTVAHFIGLGIGTSVSYFGHKNFVFRYTATDVGATIRFFSYFTLLNIAIIAFYEAIPNEPAEFTIGVIIVAVLVPLLNFLAMKFWVFPD